MDDSPATRRSLIVKLRDPADSAAWGEFVAIYEPLIYRLARRKGLQDADARDVCQEVFQAVARAIDRWEPDRGSFRGWLSRIAQSAHQFPDSRTASGSRNGPDQHAGPARGPGGRRSVGHRPVRDRVPAQALPVGGRRDPRRVHQFHLASVLADRGPGPFAG